MSCLARERGAQLAERSLLDVVNRCSRHAVNIRHLLLGEQAMEVVSVFRLIGAAQNNLRGLAVACAFCLRGFFCGGSTPCSAMCRIAKASATSCSARVNSIPRCVRQARTI